MNRRKNTVKIQAMKRDNLRKFFLMVTTMSIFSIFLFCYQAKAVDTWNVGDPYSTVETAEQYEARAVACMRSVGVFTCSEKRMNRSGDGGEGEICRLADKFKTCEFPGNKRHRKFEERAQRYQENLGLSFESFFADGEDLGVASNFKVSRFCRCVNERTDGGSFYYQDDMNSALSRSQKIQKFELAIHQQIPDSVFKLFLDTESRLANIFKNPTLMRFFYNLPEESQNTILEVMRGCRVASIEESLDATAANSGGLCTQNSADELKKVFSNRMEDLCKNGQQGNDSINCSKLGAPRITDSNKFSDQVENFYETFGMQADFDESLRSIEREALQAENAQFNYEMGSECNFMVIYYYGQYRRQAEAAGVASPHQDAMEKFRNATTPDNQRECLSGFKNMVSQLAGEETTSDNSVSWMIKNAYDKMVKEAPDLIANGPTSITSKDPETGFDRVKMVNFGENFLAQELINSITGGLVDQCRVAGASLGQLCGAKTDPTKLVETGLLETVLPVGNLFADIVEDSNTENGEDRAYEAAKLNAELGQLLCVAPLEASRDDCLSRIRTPDQAVVQCSDDSLISGGNDDQRLSERLRTATLRAIFKGEASGLASSDPAVNGSKGLIDDTSLGKGRYKQNGKLLGEVLGENGGGILSKNSSSSFTGAGGPTGLVAGKAVTAESDPAGPDIFSDLAESGALNTFNDRGSPGVATATAAPFVPTASAAAVASQIRENEEEISATQDSLTALDQEASRFKEQDGAVPDGLQKQINDLEASLAEMRAENERLRAEQASAEAAEARQALASNSGSPASAIGDVDRLQVGPVDGFTGAGAVARKITPEDAEPTVTTGREPAAIKAGQAGIIEVNATPGATSASDLSSSAIVAEINVAGVEGPVLLLSASDVERLGEEQLRSQALPASIDLSTISLPAGQAEAIIIQEDDEGKLYQITLTRLASGEVKVSDPVAILKGNTLPDGEVISGLEAVTPEDKGDRNRWSVLDGLIETATTSE